MLARLSAFAIWGLVAATAVFWGLRLLVRPPPAPAYAVAVGDTSAARGDLSRMLGAAPVEAAPPVVAPESGSRFRLLGIIAPKSSAGAPPAGNGVALIAVDGKMQKAYVVGSRVDNDLVLQSVSLRSVSLASAKGAAPITLELPLAAAAATGRLPVGRNGAGDMAPASIGIPQFVAPAVIQQNLAPGLTAPAPAVRAEPNLPVQ